MTKWRRSPRPLASSLVSVRDRLAPASLLGEIQRWWGAAVGDAIAAHAEPTAERAGVVTISCDAAVWAQELDLMGPEIVRRLNELLAAQQVSRLRCVTLPPRR